MLNDIKEKEMSQTKTPKSPTCSEFLERITTSTASLSHLEGRERARSLIDALRAAPDSVSAANMLVEALCDLIPASSWNETHAAVARLEGFASIAAGPLKTGLDFSPVPSCASMGVADE